MPPLFRCIGTRFFVAAGMLTIAGIGLVASTIWHSQSLSPPWIYGESDARFTVVLYADIECPYCREYVPSLRRWIDHHRDVKLQWHHFPLDAHEPKATVQAIAAECAGRLGGSHAFWQAVGSQLAGADRPINANALRRCLSDHDIRDWVRSQAADASARGVQGTPTVELVDTMSNESLTLPGVVDGDVLLSAIDRLIDPASDSR